MCLETAAEGSGKGNGRDERDGGKSRSAYFYCYDEDQLGSKDMPELHVMGILVLMIRRVPVISVPTKQNKIKRTKMNINW